MNLVIKLYLRPLCYRSKRIAINLSAVAIILCTYYVVFVSNRDITLDLSGTFVNTVIPLFLCSCLILMPLDCFLLFKLCFYIILNFKAYNLLNNLDKYVD